MDLVTLLTYRKMLQSALNWYKNIDDWFGVKGVYFGLKLIQCILDFFLLHLIDDNWESTIDIFMTLCMQVRLNMFLSHPKI